MTRSLAALVGLVMVCGVAEAAKPKVKKAKVQAYQVVDLPNFNTLTVVGVGAHLLVLNNAGAVVFTLDSLESDEGGVSYDSMGKVKYVKKANRIEIHFKAIEDAPEYSGPAKGVIYYDVATKVFKAACAQKICEVLP